MVYVFSRLEFCKWLTAAGLLGAVALLAGCGGEAKPVTASSSQFKVAGDKSVAAKPAETVAGGEATNDNLAADLGAAADRAAAAPDAADASAVTAEGAPAATGTAAASGGKASAAGGTDALLAKLEELGPRMFQPKGRTEEEQIAEFVKSQQQRLGIARKLVEMNVDAATKQQAVGAAMETFAMLAQLPVQGLTTERLNFARLLVKDKDQGIARIGRFIEFGVKLDDLFKGGSPDGPAVLAEVKKLLDADQDDLNPDTARIASQGAQLLMQAGLKDDAAATYELIAAACQKNPKMAEEAQKFADQAKLVKSDVGGRLLDVFKGEEGAEEQLIAGVRELLESLQPTEQIFAEIQEVAFRLEVIGKPEAAKQCLDLLAAKFKDVPDEDLAKRVDASLTKAQTRLGLIGQPFAVEGFLRDGTPFDWSSYAGKVVLVDFWATWCGPCLEEIPNIKENYEAFQGQGFEVVGVNLNTVLTDYDDFFATQELPWPSVMSKEVLDGKTTPETDFGTLPMAEKAGVNSIPFVILIGKDGTVDSIHVRGPKLKKRLTELLGQPAGAPATEIPADPTNPAGEPANPAEERPAPPAEGKAAKPAGKSGARLQRSLLTPAALMVAQAVLVADDKVADATAEEKPAAEKPATADDASINPYKAKPGLTTAQLVAFIERMLDRPKSIQARPGFAAAVSEACDRVLAAEPAAKEGEWLFAAESKLEVLHRQACAGDAECDKQLMAFVAQIAKDERPRVQKQVAFFQQERKAIDAEGLPLEQVPAVLKELSDYCGQETLSARHLRMASSTVAAINRLEDGDAREQHFTSFGEQFAKSKDKELARYGKKLAKKPAVQESDLVGKPLEIDGVTAKGGRFIWDSYRGKVVVIDFWATWCGPCKREFPNLQAFYEKHHDSGLEVVGISIDEDLEALAAYLEENQVAWETLAGDGTQQLAEKYGVRGIPTLMLVDQQGKVAGVAHNIAALAPIAEKLLKGEKIEAPKAEKGEK